MRYIPTKGDMARDKNGTAERAVLNSVGRTWRSHGGCDRRDPEESYRTHNYGGRHRVIRTSAPSSNRHRWPLIESPTTVLLHGPEAEDVDSEERDHNWRFPREVEVAAEWEMGDPFLGEPLSRRANSSPRNQFFILKLS